MPTRKFSQNNIGAVGRYMRIHSFHPTDIKLKFAEIEVIGRTFTGTLSDGTEEESMDTEPVSVQETPSRSATVANNIKSKLVSAYLAALHRITITL